MTWNYISVVVLFAIIIIWMLLLLYNRYYRKKLRRNDEAEYRRRQRANSTTIIFSIEASTNQERVGTQNKRFSWTDGPPTYEEVMPHIQQQTSAITVPPPPAPIRY